MSVFLVHVIMIVILSSVYASWPMLGIHELWKVHKYCSPNSWNWCYIVSKKTSSRSHNLVSYLGVSSSNLLLVVWRRKKLLREMPARLLGLQLHHMFMVANPVYWEMDLSVLWVVNNSQIQLFEGSMEWTSSLPLCNSYPSHVTKIHFTRYYTSITQLIDVDYVKVWWGPTPTFIIKYWNTHFIIVTTVSVLCDIRCLSNGMEEVSIESYTGARCLVD